MTEAIFFDLWNTLLKCPTRLKVETMLEQLHLKGKTDYRSVMQAMDETIFRDPSYTIEGLARKLCADYGVECTEKMIEDASKTWRSRLEETEYFPETEKVLSSLKKRYRLGLISNTDSSGAEFMKRMRLSRYFDKAIMSCEVGCAKPHGAIYDAALKALDVKSPGQAWMVGDSLDADVRGSSSAGMKAILVDRDSRHQRTDCNVVSNLEEIEGIIG